MPHTSTSTTVARSRLFNRVGLLLILCLSLSLVSCRQILTLGYLIGGPPSIEPDFDAKTNISLNRKGRKVVVLCYAPKDVKFDFDSIDRELGRHVAHRLNDQKIKVFSPDSVNAWLDEHDADWDNPGEIGKDMEADFVIFVEVKKFTLYETGSSDLYRGQSEIQITVYEMEDGEGNEIYTKELISKFPTLEPVSTSDYSFYDFKQHYLSRLSEEIGRHFYEYYSGDDIPHGSL